MTRPARHYKKLVLLAVVFGVILAVRLSPLGDLLTIENAKQYRTVLQNAVRDHYLLSVLTFIASYVLVAMLAVPGAFILTLAGGFLFGMLPTAAYVNVSATIGASLAFLVSRYLLGNWIQSRYGEQLVRFNEEISRNGARYLLSLRLVPVFPFFLINILSGFTKLPLRTFAWTTSLGIIPGSLVFSYAGREIGSISSPSDILSPRIMTAFAVLGLFALFPAVLDRFKAMRHRA